jgi:surface antigen
MPKERIGRLPQNRTRVELRSYIGLGLDGRNASAPRRAAPLVGLVVVAGLLAGCSVSMPMASLLPEAHDDMPTSSIAKSKLSDWIDGEDWQLAKLAFTQALDEKAGATTTWDNPKTGAKGSFAAVGDSYAGVAGRCRDFHADIDQKSADKTLEGTACAGKAGDWQVTDIKPAKRG